MDVNRAVALAVAGYGRAVEEVPWGRGLSVRAQAPALRPVNLCEMTGRQQVRPT